MRGKPGKADAEGVDPVAAGPAPRCTSKYRGVCWNKKNRRWQASINVGGKYMYLGSFQKEERAAKAFDTQAFSVRQDRAKLNFPECKEEYAQAMRDAGVSPGIPVPTSTAPQPQKTGAANAAGRRKRSAPASWMAAVAAEDEEDEEAAASKRDRVGAPKGARSKGGRPRAGLEQSDGGRDDQENRVHNRQARATQEWIDAWAADFPCYGEHARLIKPLALPVPNGTLRGAVFANMREPGYFGASVRDGTRFHTLERFVSADAAEQAGADIMHLVAELQWGRKHVALPAPPRHRRAYGCGDGRPPLEASPLSMHLQAHATDPLDMHEPYGGLSVADDGGGEGLDGSGLGMPMHGDAPPPHCMLGHCKRPQVPNMSIDDHVFEAMRWDPF